VTGVTGLVSVAIPVRDGGPRLLEVLEAVRGQRTERDVEIVVVDSGSTDGSVDSARALGARVEQIPPADFSHGGTRNLLMEVAAGDHVVFLTQDAVPAGDGWLDELLGGFSLGDDVALAYGPYTPRADAPAPVARELRDWFAALSPDGTPRVDRGAAATSHAAFFTDANGAITRRAWQQVPFRAVAYAEDQALAADMLNAGFAKAYVPAAAVVHSHAYPPLAQFRRSFDEFRALREVHGWVEPLAPRPVLGRLRNELIADWRILRGQQLPPARLAREAARSLRHWTVRTLGATLGSRADRLPPAVQRWCSLERRS
jgi:glycosyltransferase involved in cell wall biosynthesis